MLKRLSTISKVQQGGLVLCNYDFCFFAAPIAAVPRSTKLLVFNVPFLLVRDAPLIRMNVSATLICAVFLRFARPIDRLGASRRQFEQVGS